MYIPPPNLAPSEEAVTALLTQTRAGDLVTAGDDGLTVSMIPFLYDRTVGTNGALLGHLARPNAQWRGADGREALVLVHGPDGYVSPTWYATKREHGRVVPTWNYILVAVHGTLRVHDDSAWVRGLVERLTEAHEAGRAEPWSVSDAPEPYLAGQLRAIVGVEVEIDRLEAKWKLSQNRSEADVAGVIEGLRAGSADDLALADAMAETATHRSREPRSSG
ncbi:MAG TPA: FMN-binding negative transcriptional regulator [Candidatus Limnocylindrales bacterium]|nr:FMN-binding negative transcriptional regulator [Candidatus Limnocylindrales bacterium]